MSSDCRFRWPRRLNRGSAAARLLELRFRIWPCKGGGGCLSLVSAIFWSGGGPCDAPITRPGESYRDLETSARRRS